MRREYTLLKHFDEQEIIREKENDPFNPDNPKPNDDRIRIPRNPLVR